MAIPCMFLLKVTPTCRWGTQLWKQLIAKRETLRGGFISYIKKIGGPFFFGFVATL
jgi:hypothetical protein